jgi:hypothetical protein
VCHSARRVAPTTISTLGRPNETTCKCRLVALKSGFGPHQSHTLNHCAAVARQPLRTLAVYSDFLAPSKPTRGLEPRTPSLRAVIVALAERMVEPNLLAESAPCATRVPVRIRAESINSGLAVEPQSGEKGRILDRSLRGTQDAHLALLLGASSRMAAAPTGVPITWVPAR